MTLEVSTDQEMWVWVLADNKEVYKGPMTNDGRTWTAHQRIFVEVQDVSKGEVTFDEKRILPKTFDERTDLLRAWQMNEDGKPVSVDPQPYPATPVPTDTETALPTFTMTFSPVPTRTSTLTTTPTPSPTNSPTNTLEPSATLLANADPKPDSDSPPDLIADRDAAPAGYTCLANKLKSF